MDGCSRDECERVENGLFKHAQALLLLKKKLTRSWSLILNACAMDKVCTKLFAQLFPLHDQLPLMWHLRESLRAYFFTKRKCVSQEICSANDIKFVLLQFYLSPFFHVDNAFFDLSLGPYNLQRISTKQLISAFSLEITISLESKI